MNGNSVNLPHPEHDPPVARYTSKICSPSKRTLNNKNYLAEEAPRYAGNIGAAVPIAGQIFTHNLERTRNNTNHPRQNSINTRDYKFEVSRQETKLENNRSRSRLNAQQQQLMYENSRICGNGNLKSPASKFQKPPSQNTKSSKYVQIHDISKADVFKEPISLTERYFSPPIDLHELRREGGRLKPIINIMESKPGERKNDQIYKLTVPILYTDKSYHVVKSQIEDIYRSKYQLSQPLYLFGNKNYKYSTLDDLKNKDIKDIGGTASARVLSQPLLECQLRLASSGNDSFELSFDGKAMDRSDVFRMVDSFSVAFSDDDNEDDGSISNTNKNLLPSEMTNSVY